MIKHVGLHNAKDVIIVLHKLPMEEHMCLVLNSDKIPPAYVHEVVKHLNSEAGQNAKEFASILETATLPDGRNLGQVLHVEGHFKKVPTNQVFVTPDKVNKVRLNDLNEYLAKIAEGGDALKKLEELDKNKGMNRKQRGNVTELAETVNAQAQQLSEHASIQLPLPFPDAPVAPVASEPSPSGVTLKEHSAKLLQVAELLLQEAKVLNEKADALLPVKKKPARKAATK